MITLRAAEKRGHGMHGWLDTWHSFSFAGYYDPAHIHWGPLRVINEDRVQPGRGFGTHGHDNMEIISYVLAGALGHKDSMGTQSRIVPGEVQRMSAGTGITHSEFNYEEHGLTHFLQIWIIPSQRGLPPSYEQTAFSEAEKRGRLRLVASPDGRDGSVTIHQDAYMFSGLFDGNEQVEYQIPAGRLGYVHVARGEAEVNGRTLRAGDALLYEDEPEVAIANGDESEILVFDLPRM
ncbi:MAG: pirin family protein [Xanthomonadaceae bacterium]|jgi:redox-sensitive bicupin YhaK (pirin superfamily)|nr:pirin family protein [Xanthomonadaceae bacterium]